MEHKAPQVKENETWLSASMSDYDFGFFWPARFALGDALAETWLKQPKLHPQQHMPPLDKPNTTPKTLQTPIRMPNPALPKKTQRRRVCAAWIVKDLARPQQRDSVGESA